MSDGNDDDDSDDQADVPAVCSVNDPSDADQEEDAADAPETAKVTHDPNRYTVFVPLDETVFSLGKGSPTWIKDDGITGRTKKHIHLEVKEEDKTIVVLGGPSLDSGLCGWEGDSIAAENNGYAMVTDGFAWQEAKEQHVILCSEGDVVVRQGGEKKVLVQADGGDLKLAAGESIIIGAKQNIQVYAHSAAKMEDPRHKTAVAKKLEQEFETNWSQKITSAFDNLQTVYGAISSAFAMTRKEGKWHKPEVSVKNGKEVVAVAADIAKMIAGFLPKAKTGNLEIIAENDAGLVAGKGVEIFGKTSVGISSAVTCDIISLTTGMKALTYAGVWGGLMGSLKGGLDVCVQAEHGEAELVAKKDVTIESQSEGVKIEGKEKVQMVGAEGSAAVWGEKWAYFGSGKGDGCGLKADGSGKKVIVGMLGSADKFDSASAKGAGIMTLQPTSVSIYAKGAGILLDGDSAKFFSKGDAAIFKLSDSGVCTGDGKKILLG